jgi:hypothetical protein
MKGLPIPDRTAAEADVPRDLSQAALPPAVDATYEHAEHDPAPTAFTHFGPCGT